MKRTQSLEELIRVIEPLVEASGYSLIDVVWGSAYGRRTLSVTIYKPEGVLISDCQSLSRAIGKKLDELDLVKGSYVLEVSSPGAERPLKQALDYERFVGRYALIHTREPIAAGQTTELYGYLRGLEDNTDVLLEVADRETIKIPLSQIAKARLAIKF